MLMDMFVITAGVGLTSMSPTKKCCLLMITYLLLQLHGGNRGLIWKQSDKESEPVEKMSV